MKRFINAASRSRTDLERFFLTMICVLTFFHTIQAAAGDLDLTFGSGGYTTTNIGMRNLGRSMAIQSDGRILVSGEINDTSSLATVRYNTNGSLDLTFGNGGIVLESFGEFSFTDIVIQDDGKIVVTCEIRTLRYNTNGSRDSSFGSDGVVNIGGNAFALQNDGKILIGESNQLTRLNQNGSLDLSFGMSGQASTTVGAISTGVNAIAVQSDGKIVVAGTIGSPLDNSDVGVLRFSTGGILDFTFNGDGLATFDSSNRDGANDVRIQSDGKIVVAGFTGFAYRFLVLRYNSDGELDSRFDGDGVVILQGNNSNGIAKALVIQSDGRIIAAGENDSGGGFMSARFTQNGSLDTSFGRGQGFVTTTMDSDAVGEDAALQFDGKLLVAGYRNNNPSGSSFAIARYLVKGIAPFDYDGDQKTDISVFRPLTGAWYLQRSRDGLYGAEFGFGDDRITPADYDGDRKADIAVYRASTGIWYILNSSDGTVSYFVFGLAEDLPTPSDYDGDGIADVSVFRPSNATWYRRNSSDGSFYAIQLGLPGDKPTLGDFDGDGKSDIAIFRPSDGAWYQLYSSDNSLHGREFGFVTDVIVHADYDGDGKTDIAVFRPSDGIWYIANSSDGTVTYNVFGLADDKPAPGDFDGDGKADISVFRPSDGTWYRKNSSDGSFFAFQFGTSGDKPTQTAFRY